MRSLNINIYHKLLVSPSKCGGDAEGQWHLL